MQYISPLRLLLAGRVASHGIGITPWSCCCARLRFNEAVARGTHHTRIGGTITLDHIYTATITHHSISRARVIKIEGTLTQAKRAATKEFADELRDYRIVITNGHGEIAAARRVGDARWSI